MCTWLISYGAFLWVRLVIFKWRDLWTVQTKPNARSLFSGRFTYKSF